jgi:hypothetical protein
MQNEDSEGEELIREFLDDKAIEAMPKKIIPNLRDDDREFREADFYLPKYDVYVEFLGQWNDPEHQRRYRQKMAVYYKNKIPCVYLWPDNLGTLDWMLKRRIRQVLLRYKKWWYLFKYEWDNYSVENGWFILLMIIGIFYFKDLTGRLILLVLLLLSLFGGISGVVRKLKKLKRSKWVSGTEDNEHK